MSRFGICKHMSILFAGAVVGGQLGWFGGYVFNVSSVGLDFVPAALTFKLPTVAV